MRGTQTGTRSQYDTLCTMGCPAISTGVTDWFRTYGPSPRPGRDNPTPPAWFERPNHITWSTWI
jgi:hypothetical protein